MGNIGGVANGTQFSCHCSETAKDLPSDWPECFPQFALSVQVYVVVCQNFTPPNYSHLWYLNLY